MVTVPMKVLVSIGVFSTYQCCEGVVGSGGNKGVQERYGTIFFGLFHSEQDVLIQGVDVPEKLSTLFCLLDDKDVIHKPKP